MLISFEGIDGSGKTTQSKMLHDYLNKKGAKVYYTREPGWEDPISEIMRTLIRSESTSPRQKMFLLLADRAAHFDKVIGPALTDFEAFDNFVIMDRGLDSLIAYQGFGQALAPLPWLVEANQISTGETRASTTFLIDIDPVESMKRIRNKKPFQQLGLEFYKRVRNGYLEMAKMESGRFVVLDGTQSKESLHQTILGHILARHGEIPCGNKYSAGF